MKTASEKLKIEVVTFDAEYLMQFTHNDVVLFTVGQPSGPAVVTQFCIWDADGIDDETGDNLEPLQMTTFDSKDVEAAWKDIVRTGYRLAMEVVFNGRNVDNLFRGRGDDTRKDGEGY
jgi:hypothetical protein